MNDLTEVHGVVVDKEALFQQPAYEPLGEAIIEIQPYETDTVMKMFAYLYDPGGKPARILRCGDDSKFVVAWSLEGGLAEHLCGKFCVTVRLESIGAGEELTLRSNSLIDFEPCDQNYRWEFSLNDADIRCDPCGSVYKVAVTITSQTACGNPGHIAAFIEGPTIMVQPKAHANG